MTQTAIKKPCAIVEPRILRARLAEAYFKARADLLSQPALRGNWVGEPVSSSLSTATAICALSSVDRKRLTALIACGIGWLLEHQNNDGGWGDTAGSLSTLSTTVLCRAALEMGKDVLTTCHIDESLQRAEDYLERVCGGRGPRALTAAVQARYGKDRALTVPILSCCALAGLTDWSDVPALPFEFAHFSASYKWLNLPMMSSALPAFFSLGIVQAARCTPGNPILRFIRQAAVPGALDKLGAMQPLSEEGLDSTPLVSFITMSLAGAGLTAHPIVRKGVGSLVRSVRPDGSWPGDPTPSTWVRTLSINALSEAGVGLGELAGPLRRWLFDQQARSAHPLTAAAPGGCGLRGWGWTPLLGAVPDAEDTAGALIALRNLGVTVESREAVLSGLECLADLQNRDGGWSSFGSGWGDWPFDGSSADITAYALRALGVWEPVRVPQALSQRLQRAIQEGFRFLRHHQRSDGSWRPRWHGNRQDRGNENPIYATARVLTAYRDLNLQETKPAQRGCQWLVSSQNREGNWGGIPPSIEETALAVEALLGYDRTAGVNRAIARGLRWLIERVEDGSFLNASPIGFYFTKLWRFEKLYPLIFTVGALGRAFRLDVKSGMMRSSRRTGEPKLAVPGVLR